MTAVDFSAPIDWNRAPILSQHSWAEIDSTVSTSSYQSTFPYTFTYKPSRPFSTAASFKNGAADELSYSDKAKLAKTSAEKQYRRMENEKNAARNREKRAARQREIDRRAAERQAKRDAKSKRRHQWNEKERARQAAEQAARDEKQRELAELKEKKRLAYQARIAAGKPVTVPVTPRKLFIGLKWDDVEQLESEKAKEALRRRRIAVLREICQRYGPVQSVRVRLDKHCMFVLFVDAASRDRALKSLVHFERRKQWTETPEFNCLTPAQFYVRKPKGIHNAQWATKKTDDGQRPTNSNE